MSAEKKEEKPAEDEILPGLDDQPPSFEPVEEPSKDASKTDEEMTNEEAK